MKKFLFTLATLCVAFGAYAFEGPVMDFAKAEVTLGAGETEEVVTMLTSNDILVKGLQIQWSMQSPTGQEMDPAVVGLKKAYGPPRNPYLFDARGITIESGASVGSSMPANYTAMYRILLSNSTTGECWYPGDDEYQSELPAPVWAMTVAVGDGWEDEYALLKLDNRTDDGGSNYARISTNSDYLSPDGLTVYYYNHDMTLKVINKDYSAAELTADITLNDNNGYNASVTVENVSVDNYEVKVKVNGEYVDVDDEGNFVLGEEPAYGDFEVIAEVWGEGYDEPVTATRTYTIEQPTAANPEITFTPGEDENGEYVEVNATPATSVFIHINGGAEAITEVPTKIYKDYVEQVITVEAQNAPQGYKPSETVNDEYTLAAKEKKTVNAPTYTTSQTDTDFTVTVAGDPASDGELVVMDGDGNDIANPKTYERKADAYDVEVVAYTAEGETCKQSPIARWTITVPALEVVTPEELEGELVFSEVNQENGTFTVTYNGPEEGVAVNITNYQKRDGNGQLPGYGTYAVTATASKDGYETLEKTENLTWNQPVTEKPTIVVTSDADNYYVTVEAAEGVATLYDENGEEITDLPVVLPRPEVGQDAVFYYFSADAIADGKAVSEKVYETVKVEPKAETPTEQTSAPGIAATPQTKAYDVTLTSQDPEAVLYYRVTYPDGTVSEWMEYEDVLSFTEYGVYTVEAKAKAPGKTESVVVSVTFEVTENTVPTSVSELINGKTVAGVRYFNMAGQEMQEANGVTIVVTTYTDGTTSAVKVMK